MEMLNEMLTLIFIISELMNGVESSGSCSSSPFELSKESYENKRISGFTLGTFGSNLLAECAKECAYITRCKSFSSLEKSEQCDLYTTDSGSVTPSTESGWTFSDLSEWPKVMFGTCADKPCGSDKRCVPSKPYTCLTEVYNLACSADNECSAIKGTCQGNKCVCPSNHVYDEFARKCIDYTNM